MDDTVKPIVGVVMGSSSDWDVMQHAVAILKEFGVPYEAKVVSAHRMPDEMFTYEEGCLSIPEYFDQVERPARVRVAYLNRDGERIEEEIEGLYAVCFQHELDHLNGVLFIDHLSRLRRDRAMTKVKKCMRNREAA